MISPASKTKAHSPQIRPATMDMGDSAISKKATARKAKRRTIVFCIAAAAICACIAISFLMNIAFAGGSDSAFAAEKGYSRTEAADAENSSNKTADAQDRLDEAALMESSLSDKMAHSHTWIPITATIHHQSKTKEIEHPDVYASKTSYHTVCNECQAVIDGVAAAHIRDTQHSGYTTNVPLTEQVLEQASYTETVVLEDPWDETVTTGIRCVECGAAGSL